MDGAVHLPDRVFHNPLPSHGCWWFSQSSPIYLVTENKHKYRTRRTSAYVGVLAVNFKCVRGEGLCRGCTSFFEERAFEEMSVGGEGPGVGVAVIGIPSRGSVPGGF